MMLKGLKILDLTRVMAGPFCTALLADLGAEVIKLEPPQGDDYRHIGPFVQGESALFTLMNRGKQSIVLDLKDADAQATARAIALHCDVVVENFRPDVKFRLGIDYERIAAMHPRIVYASIAAFGQTGPDSHLATHDLGMEALAGVLSLNLGQDGQPTHPHMPVSDITGSMMALSGILMALYRREQSGRGDYIDISMHDSTLSWLPNATGAVFAQGRAPNVQQERSWGGNSFYNIYRTADDKHLVLGAVEPKFIRNLLTALGASEWIDTATQPPGPVHEPVKAFLRATFVQKTRDEWMQWFQGKDVAIAPVLDLKEAFDRPQLQAREMLLQDAQGQLHIGNPIKFRHEPAQIDTRLPGLGEHTASVLAQTPVRKEPP